MADKKASLVLELKDLVSSGLSKIDKSLGALGLSTVSVTAGFAALTGIMIKALSSYSEQEMAVNKLNQALKNQGIESEAVTTDLVKFADQIQKTTTFADDAVLSAMALGTTFGLTGNQLKETTKIALDMSAAMGIDLKTTMLLLGKAAVGETGTLSRYGIVISENISKSERFAAALEQINNRFGGSAAKQAETYAGQLIQLKNSFDDLFESIGAILSGPAVGILKWTNEAVKVLGELVTGNDAITGTYRDQIISLREQVKVQEEHVLSARRSVVATDELKKKEEDRLRVLQSSLSWYEKENEAIKLKAKLQAEAKATTVEAGPDEETTKLIEKAQAQIDATYLTENEIANIKTNAMADELMRKGQHTQAIALLEAQQTANAKLQADNRAKNMASTLNTIATLANSHNKTLAVAGKAAGIANATIDTYSAANKALASAPPPWNFALAALVTAAGFANVASISGVKLAEGGMIMPSNGGTSAIMAEAGKAEVAIPLDDERTKDKLRDVLGGNTIVIQAGTIVADDYSVTKLAEKIDEKLYHLQRNRRSYL